jgi:hypothetical protein
LYTCIQNMGRKENFHFPFAFIYWLPFWTCSFNQSSWIEVIIVLFLFRKNEHCQF